MKKLIKGVMGVTSIAVMAAGAYYLTKKLLAEPDEELDDEFEDFDFEDEDESDEDVSGDRSREYVTLDFDEENSDSEESAESDKKEEE
ncbi:MAG: hypothetical protein MR965_11260 [Lachnospiraceae bacterium]|nr:hypothetical protein [Lachnospiraceae bacterium]